MRTVIPEPSRPSLARRALALFVLIAATVIILKLAVHVVVGVITALFWAVVAIAAVLAVVWAIRVL